MKIDFQNITMSYGEKKVFSDFSHTFALQGITALMGESGSGKTTLLRLLCGLEEPQCGKISGIPKRFTFMFQEDRLLPWATAFENVALASDAETAAHWLTAVGLCREFDSLPAALSGGMQRRVSFARALAHESGLLLLDEPFKGLDADLRAEMLTLLCSEAEKRPVLFVTHDAQEAQSAEADILYLHGSPAIL